MKTATWQDTFDHIMGAGALHFDWWAHENTTGADTPGWESTLTVDDGNGAEKTFTVSHSVVLSTARKIMKNKPRYASDELVRQSRNLIFNADETDFDAASADEFLQVIAFGEVVFG